MLLAGSPPQDEATLGPCGVEALATLEVVGRGLGGERGSRGQTGATGLFTLLRPTLPFACLKVFALICNI